MSRLTYPAVWPRRLPEFHARLTSFHDHGTGELHDMWSKSKGAGKIGPSSHLRPRRSFKATRQAKEMQENVQRLAFVPKQNWRIHLESAETGRIVPDGSRWPRTWPVLIPMLLIIVMAIVMARGQSHHQCNCIVSVVRLHSGGHLCTYFLLMTYRWLCPLTEFSTHGPLRMECTCSGCVGNLVCMWLQIAVPCRKKHYLV